MRVDPVLRLRSARERLGGALQVLLRVQLDPRRLLGEVLVPAQFLVERERRFGEPGLPL